MAYSDFTLKKVKFDFNLKIIENISLFSDVAEIEISDQLHKTLKRNVPLALSINTEKARSELIIINVLLELKDNFAEKISFFSGIDFTVDRERGLNGFCDYIISQSPEQLYIDIPVIAIVEAKNENIINGIGQCIAEMIAVKIYNEKEKVNLPCIYGAVTTGDEWRFIKLINELVYIDTISYYINDIKKIVSILVTMLK